MSRGGSGTITLSYACLSLAGAFTMMPSSDKTKCHLRTRSCWRVSHQESTFYSVKVGLSIRPERAYPPLPFWLFPLVLSKQLDFIWNNFQHSLIGSFGTERILYLRNEETEAWSRWAWPRSHTQGQEVPKDRALFTTQLRALPSTAPAPLASLSSLTLFLLASGTLNIPLP